MVFAWEGFSVEHPDEWAPVVLSGNRDEGYARLEAPKRLALQVRWLQTKNLSPRKAVDRYLDRLSGDAKRAGNRFSRDVEENDGQVGYRYSGMASGRGCLFPAQGRLFFLEIIGGPKDSLLSPFKKALGSFECGNAGLQRWSLLGLDVRLPTEMSSESKELQAGKTLLRLHCKGASVVAERWGFAEQLLAKHDLTSWVSAIVGSDPSFAEDASDGLGIYMRFDRPLRPAVHAMVKIQPLSNQMTLIRAETRQDRYKPQWNWFV